MLDLVPLTRSRREMTDGNRQLRFIGELLHFPFPESYPVTITTSRVGSNKKLARFPICWFSHHLPPSSDSIHGEGRSVVIDAHTDPSFVAFQIIHSVGYRLSLFGDEKIVYSHRFRVAFRPPFTSRILEIANKFLFLGIHRDDRLSVLLLDRKSVV